MKNQTTRKIAHKVTRVTHKDKLKLIIWFAVAVVGVLLMYSITKSQQDNPPPDADIGAGMIYVLSMAIAVVGGAAFTAILIVMALRGRLRSIWLVRAISLALVMLAVFVGWWLIAGAGMNQDSQYNKEIQSRYGSFLAYQEPVDFKVVSGRQSGALSTDNVASPISARLDLHDCSPGAAKVNDTAGTTYFAFSGVKKDEHADDFSDCVFYVGREVKGRAWDGMLNAKCTWVIATTLDSNTLQYPVSASGIQFGDLLGHCQDLRTGTAPVDLN